MYIHKVIDDHNVSFVAVHRAKICPSLFPSMQPTWPPQTQSTESSRLLCVVVSYFYKINIEMFTTIVICSPILLARFIV